MIRGQRGLHKLLRKQVIRLIREDEELDKLRDEQPEEDEEEEEKPAESEADTEKAADDAAEDTSKEDAEAVPEPVEDETAKGDSYPYTIELSGIRLKDEFAKAFFLFTRAKFKKWSYEDQLMNWQPEVVNKALKDYKRFMLDVVLGETHGDVEAKGLLAKPEFLGLADIHAGLAQQKYGGTREISSLLRKQVTAYMQMVFPFEKRIIFDLFQAGYISTKGELQKLDKAIKFLSLREPQQYKSEEEKELDSDVVDTKLDREMGEDEDI